MLHTYYLAMHKAESLPWVFSHGQLFTEHLKGANMADHVAVGPGQSMVAQTQAASQLVCHTPQIPPLSTAHISYTARVHTHRFTYNDL